MQEAHGSGEREHGERGEPNGPPMPGERAPGTEGGAAAKGCAQAKKDKERPAIEKKQTRQRPSPR